MITRSPGILPWGITPAHNQGDAIAAKNKTNMKQITIQLNGTSADINTIAQSIANNQTFGVLPDGSAWSVSEVSNKPRDRKAFILSPSDKLTLLSWGHPIEDFEQIEDATNVGKFRNATAKRNITWQTARKKLGDHEFLSGISRAAFHWDCVRYTEDESTCIEFDFRNYFGY